MPLRHLIIIQLLIIQGICYYQESVRHHDEVSTYSFLIKEPVTNPNQMFNTEFRRIGALSPAVTTFLDSGLDFFDVTLQRGRRDLTLNAEPNGAIVMLGFADSTSSSTSSDLQAQDLIWERFTTGLPALVGAVSLDPSVINSSLRRVKVTDTVSVMHVPQQTVCTDNLAKVLSHLPCGKERGLGAKLLDRGRDLAGGRFFRLRVRGERRGLIVWFRVQVQTDVSIGKAERDCPFDERGDLDGDDLDVAYPALIQKRFVGWGMTDGIIEYSVTILNGALELRDHIPWYLFALTKTLRVTQGDCLIENSHFIEGRTPSVKRHDGVLSFRVTSLSSLSTCVIRMEVLKRIVPTRDFTFAAEKGFDASGVHYTELADVNLPTYRVWRTSNGVLIPVFVSDGSMPFNTMAVVLSSLFFLYNAISRSIAGTKRVGLIELGWSVWEKFREGIR